ncbi:MAG: hypothetical protein N4A38_04055 [Candidatus Gracilibacteria bacterium]|nr:hypothetical protein [Candidatus Gracilibacteria bacterium]
MKKILSYIILTITLLGQGYCFAKKFDNAVDVISDLKGSNDTADKAVQGYVGNALTFLYLAAVILGIYGGFLIMTAGGDDEKVKKGKTIVLEAMLGIIVIFLASSLVTFLITGIFGQKVG